MNINAGRNTVNLSLAKDKERPSFATVFDKLNARKLNRKNPLNAVLTQEQMFRYYLEETEPKLGEMPDNFDLEDTIGGQSLADMKLRDFAKLLSGDFEGNKATPVYETLTAGVSYPSMIAPLIAPPTLPALPTPVPTPVPTPTPTPPPTIPIAVIPAPGSSVASALAPPIPVSGLMPTGTGSIPVIAPVVPAPVAPVSAPVVPAPVVPAVAAAAPTAALTISTAPSAAGIATPPFSPSSVFASLSSGVSSAMGAVSSLVSSKPSPSAVLIPSSAVASGSATAVASTVPTVAGTPTPATGVGTPAIAGAAAGAPPVSGAEIAAVAMTTAQNAGYKKREDIDAYIDGLNEGLDPPERPSTLKGAIDIENEDWIKYTISLITYNKMASTPFKLTDKQLKIAENYERALKTAADKNDLESIVQNTIIIAQTPKPAGGAKSGKKKK